ncbi:MBL fold metallo-hydrolase, partial [candidate division KSB1 bacterium]|nr:MBL fold metallo-hydrolase [candidate division KSB1 bacterium]NIR68929.1 MBL fold metallo-hydrolase [candidate division KSB1 bacterium]NIS22583.1 MBL fold metallo-hydrolase [candidate division KSB1 bacterium]NIT69431.1 MBL fold metallo-hydrolase [candidate division KSB1 bacterium]NIU23086.1 MBL fold metallo-hydrolase [candidate division KSB1 bacterium]
GNNADTFAENVKALNVDLTKIDIAVLSHRHFDHASGFDHLLKVNPEVKLYLPFDWTLGPPYDGDVSGRSTELTEDLPPEQKYFMGKTTKFKGKTTGRFWRANAEFVNRTKEIAPGVTLIFTRSALLGDWSKYPPHDEDPRMTGMPELSLALYTKKGEILVVGCSHSGVEEIVRQTKDFLKREIDLITGGFHLMPYKLEYVSDLASELRDDLDVGRVAPAHCTGELAFKIFKEIYGRNYLISGLGTVINF